MKHRAHRRPDLALLADRLRHVRRAGNEFMIRWAMERLVVAPLLLDPVLGALDASGGPAHSADSSNGASSDGLLQPDRPSTDEGD